MRKCVLLIVMSIQCAAICYSQELPDSLKQRNGTYFESRNRYNDSSYVRIQYLNDTILAFHFNNSPFIDGEWLGIGRLVSDKGEKNGFPV